ncbi:hypothetical protein Sango_1269100 [Sesamum angolense]|uniref:Uncharacterized protein n=1 Tax=Sesamum angolense TaxID=2727404 RepID=A0AAE1WR51_9LAMI|nr:hypothetical protein Sango_1269100 [Sesamum angolense]
MRSCLDMDASGFSRWFLFRSATSIFRSVRFLCRSGRILRISSILWHKESTFIGIDLFHSSGLELDPVLQWPANALPRFLDCLGALDGMYIDVRVPEVDKGYHRTRKKPFIVNVLGVCDINMQFIYVLTAWERSAADSRADDEGNSKQCRHGAPLEKCSSRRIWFVKEDEMLLIDLKSLIVNG